MQHRQALHRWQESGKWYKYRGHSIFCQVAGKGEPLVLIHGFPSASWDWSGVWKLLAEHFQVITLDMIGFGFSDKPAKYTYSIVDQADLFESVLSELGITRCHVLSHDYGDSVAQELMYRQYENPAKVAVESVCFLNGGIFPELHKPALIQKLLLGSIGHFVSRLITRSVMDQNMCRIFGPLTQPTNAQLESFWHLLEYNNGRAIMHKIIRYLDERRSLRHRWVAPMMDGNIPLCFINGIDDPVAGKEMVARYREVVSQPYVVELIGVGHYPHVELPSKVFDAYLVFRERVSAGVAH